MSPREDDQDVGLRVDTKAQLCPVTTPCDLFSKHTGPVNRKVQPVETWRIEPTSREASGCAYSTDLNVGTPWLDFTTVVSQYVDKTVGCRIHAQVLVTPVRRTPHSHFFCAETDAGVGNTSMVIRRQRPSVRAVGLLVDTVPFETVETVKRSSC